MHCLKDLKACLTFSKRGRGVRARFKEPLSTHTTLRIGGPADLWVEPRDFAELSKIVCRCAKERIPYLVLGYGSNILFSDRGFKGVVICLQSAAFSKMEIRGNRISCGAGLSLQKLLRRAQKRGWGGLEFLAGIPASAGGAVVMNAGNRQNNIGSFIDNVIVMDRKGKVRRLKKRELKFSYRQSNLNKYILLEVALKLVKVSPKRIKENIAANLAQKRKTQDLTTKSAGCIFKNPSDHLTAGEMIEACGLKNRRHGGAEISGKHANYIVNRNSASARDILYLINLAQRQVKKKFGVFLEPEIRIFK